jgi:hypothetical protein
VAFLSDDYEVSDEDYVAFLSVNYERTWWRLCGFPICWLWTYLMKIMWLSYLLTMNVPDEDYSKNKTWNIYLRFLLQ